MVPFESFDTVSYSHFIATMVVSLAVSGIFSIKEWVRSHSRSLKMAPFDRTRDFLLVGYCKYSSILYHFRVIWCWI